MAQYTIELRNILPHYNIFGFPYEIYDEKKRLEFEEAFKRHFYFREICCPEPERFIHFLSDKMTTVFPYYNELMRTATIEYDIENPYNLTETYTRKTDNMGKVAGFASAVGRSESLRDSTGSTVSEGSNTDTEKTVATSEGSETGNNTVNREGTTQESGTKKDVNKRLDTPQGKLNLDDTDYLTELIQNESDHSAEQVSGSTETGESERKTEGNSETLRTLNGANNQKTDSTTSETGEEKTTSDTNTRTESIGNQVEEYTMTRKGNIGVNPASYEIDSHIKTQKTLKRIYEMFFEECEDLFMLVF